MNKRFISVTVVLLCLCLCSCEKWMAEHLGRIEIGFKNDAQYHIVVYSPIVNSSISSDSTANVFYPDTTLCPHRPQWLYLVRSKHDTILDYFPPSHCRDVWPDTASFFVFNFDSIVKYGWDAESEGKILLQRYDITYDDYKNCISYLSFPPNEYMHNFKMWPSYGTYDSNGFRIQ